MKTIENRIARTIVLVVSLLMSFPVFGQNIDYKSSFDEAYKDCPDIPRGLLEAISFTNTHCTHLTDADYFNDDSDAIPRSYGLMGLMKDGKGCFRENLHLVSELSGISETEILQDPSTNVMAYAKAFSRLAKESRASEIKDYLFVIQQLSELPIEEDEEDNYPMQSMLYSVCLFLNDAQRAEEYSFPKQNIDLKAVFAEHYILLTAPELIATRDGDYSQAIWNPAASCNFSERNRPVSAVVIHYTEGTYAGSIAWFKDCRAKASAHYIIRSSDGQVTQMVREEKKAWHARTANPYTIGIEHEAYGSNIASFFTEAMYQSSANLVRDICSRRVIDRHSTFFREFVLHNGVPYDNGLHDLGGEGSCIKIRGHQHFPDQTHIDPGPYWDWNKYYKLINIDDPVVQLGGPGVRSGNFNYNSGNDLRKIWVITSDENTYIELKFDSIQLEEDFDFLWFYNGNQVHIYDDDNIAELGPCNLSNTSFGVVSSSNAMCIEFRADCQGSYPSSWVATWEVKDKCEKDISCLNAGSQGLKDSQTTNQLVYESVTKYHEYMDAMSNFLSHVIGLTYWFDVEKGIAFWNLFQSLLDDNTGMISEAEIQQLINQNQFEELSEDLIMTIVERYNQSVLYWNEGYYTNDSLPEGYGGVIEYDTAAMRKAYEAQAYAESLGFSDVRQMYDNAYELLEAEVGNQQTSVCASVTMQFSHKASMTREAFNGTLQIFNGHESIPMQDIFVDFRIEDQQGNDCTNLFQINTFSLDQITGISGNGSLPAQANGTATVQFIPTKNAAPTEPKVYSFGGSFSFIDPFTGEGLTYPLYPVDITVNPSPDLYVDYFMQRDILGDDALTLDVVEPSVPAELGVIINNKGAGMAKNVLLETAEPQIIDNEHGLAIDFAMYGASFNGSPRQLGLMEIPFGNIESGQTAVGEWLFTSSLLGHFVSYTAHVIHNSSYGNPDLSLVSHLDIHELIHPIYAYANLDDGINDFLVNDNPDAYDTPDSIYFSHGGRTAVGIVDNISFDHYVEPQDTIVILTINPSRIGWNYGVTEDPGRDNYDLVSCTRDFDGQVIPLNNVWQTFVTIPDGGDPVYENKLHIVDTLSNDVQDFTYTLVYSLKNNLLDILEITGIPESYIDYPLESFTVKFNEAIIDSTFTYEDMTLKCQNGPNLMDSTIVITKVNDSIYDVNISGLTNETGLYVLNVSTLNIKDSRGYNGYKGKQASWVQVLTGQTQISMLMPGWNWWSTYIEQNGIDGLGILENSLGESGVGIRSQANGFNDYYSGYGWYGTLASINNESSYRIITNEPCFATMTGYVAVPSQHPITLDYGWTWMGYLPSTALDVNTALDGLESVPGDQLKSLHGYADYYEDYGWYGSLNTLEPGMGLMYKSTSSETITFTYPDNARADGLKANITPENNHWVPNTHAYPDNMTLTAVVELDSIELKSDHYELAAFDANGECRGSIRLMYAEPISRHIAFLTIAGDEPTLLYFNLFDTDSQEEYVAVETVVYEKNASLGMVLHFNSTLGVDEFDHRVQVFPNPVDRGGRISIVMNGEVKAPVQVEIIDALGVETLRTTSLQTPAMLTAPAITGVYMLRITVEGEGTCYRKLIVK